MTVFLIVLLLMFLPPTLGRATRSRWALMLPALLVTAAAAWLVSATTDPPPTDSEPDLGLIWAITALVPSLIGLLLCAVTVRRSWNLSSSRNGEPIGVLENHRALPPEVRQCSDATFLLERQL